MTRAERYEQFKALRDEGLLLREIAARTGVAISTVRGVLSDPSGEAARARKARYRTPCPDCGTLTNPNGLRQNGRCGPCAVASEARATRRWILESFAEWAEMFGAPPSAVDWSPAMARAKGMTWKLLRTERTGRPWPAPNTVAKHFGSWNEGIKAAGFQPITPAESPFGRHGQALRAEEAEAA